MHYYFDTPDISPIAVLDSDDYFKPWLRRIYEFLNTNLKGFRFERLKNRSLQFVYHHSNCVIKVDLLVSPHWDRREDFYDFLKSIDRQERDK